jgi:hypothetical protein
MVAYEPEQIAVARLRVVEPADKLVTECVGVGEHAPVGRVVEGFVR